ncbi:MAG: hypothetical protein CSYNP_03683 [Syntrophus sp. SKADARSKE-3]|nr:hypothetical protein [Syntrophus sp. SKADARSKE-3]
MQRVKMYTLSTCSHCKATKQFLKQCDVQYDATDVDLLEGDQKQLALNEVANYNPNRSFPTIIIGDKIIIGFNEKALREALGIS